MHSFPPLAHLLRAALHLACQGFSYTGIVVYQVFTIGKRLLKVRQETMGTWEVPSQMMTTVGEEVSPSLTAHNGCDN